VSLEYSEDMSRRAVLSILACGVAVLAGATWALADRMEDTLFIPLDHPAIQYDQRPSKDPVALLEQRMESGRVKLDYAPNGWGYLPSVLKELGVNVDSQVLVFSKTSIQAAKIGPKTPRAIYFNDDVSVGFVRDGEVLELTALDPQQGVKLYTLDEERSDQPEFGQRDDCLQCHQGPVTLAVPGLLVSSVHPSTGGPREEHGSAYMTDHRTPFDERWGGWYVTGTHGSQYHLGNNVGLVNPIHPGPPSKQGTQNVTSLEGMFDTSKYLAPTSDIVALMTLEHQVRMTNLMTRIGWDARIAVHDGKLDEERKQLNEEIDEMVGYMLFADEEPLHEPVQGVSTFTKTFPQRGPRDKKGRSLRDFDLKTRLFRYPLSYMIYTAAFDGMPDLVRERVYQRLYDILTGKDHSETFARLSAQDRSAILEILRDTKPGLPAYWTASSPE
jgi:hypothetical protein